MGHAGARSKPWVLRVVTDGDHSHRLIQADIVTAVGAEEDRAKAAEKALSDRIAALEGLPPTIPTPPVSSGVFGPAINCDTKANLQVGWTNKARLSHRFRCTVSSSVTAVRCAQRGGSGYSGGTGGTMRVSIQGDKSGSPDGNVLAFGSWGPKVPSGGIFDNVPMTSSASLTAGKLYHVVYENVDPAPQSNYVSINHLFVYTAVTPRQPKFPDTDLGVLYDSGAGWVLQGKYTPCIDVAYANGKHDGQGYIGMIGSIPASNYPVSFAAIGGTAMCRERFTPTADHIVSSASVRVRRQSGTGALTLSLDGVALGSIAATSVPLSSAGADNGGSVWAQVRFVGNLTIKGGIEHALTLTAPSGTTYTAAPIRAGTDSGFDASLSFSEGTFEYTTDGKTWAEMYPSSPLDLQLVLL